METDKKIVGVFPFGGVNPGTQMEIKRWDIDKFAEAVNEISKNNFVILFQGREPSEEITSEFQLNENVVIKTMDNDILTVCDVFLSGDTGPLHIAAAFGVNTVSLFGPSDPNLLKPLSTETTKNILMWKKPECSPCYTPATAADRGNPKYWQGNRFICHTGTHICMKSISVEEVTASINKLTLNK
ncbi:unnamed protein product [Rotaria sp. Silwood1]|nr:unnamed protein product [Rotaria sp. Silwood1]CAF4563347.1 unnamed protein product [Rotaria sp. Silwood1]